MTMGFRQDTVVARNRRIALGIVEGEQLAAQGLALRRDVDVGALDGATRLRVVVVRAVERVLLTRCLGQRGARGVRGHCD